MILHLENWYLGYAEILKVCREGGSGSNGGTNGTGTTGESSALILCHANVDALCAGRILSYMLRNDNVNHQLYPCISQAQLQKRVAANRLCRAVVLLNMGATRNLTKLFGDANDSDSGGLDPTWTKVFVMDCSRPVHLANIYAERNIVVFWDETQQDSELPSDGDNLSGDESSSSSEDDDEDGDDDENDDRSAESEENEFIDKQDENEFSDDESLTALPSSKVVIDKEPTSTSTSTSTSTTTGIYPNIDVGMKQATDYDGEDEGDVRTNRTHPNQSADDGSVTANPGADLDESSPTSKQLPTLTPREQHNERRNRLRQYYAGGSYFGSPAAYTSYTIATQLRFQEVGDLLWLACVGVTDAYVHSRLDVSGYSALALHLRNICNGLFPNDDFSRVSNTVYSEHLLGGGGGSNTQQQQQLTRISFSGNGRILSESDFRFFLLRHSSLLEAMMCSDYVTTRLQLPTDAGRQKLHEMLAKMGYPLDQCEQPFAFMKPALRRQLQDKLREYADEYGLTNFEFTSFFRITGYQSLLSACDTSYAVTALLECDAPGFSWMDADTVDEEDQLVEAFNVAYDALNSNQAASAGPHGLSGDNLGNLVNGGKLSNTSGLGAGIKLAQSLQKAIMTMAGNLMDRNAITRLSHFRYAYITVSNQAMNDPGFEPTGNENIRPSSARRGDNKDSYVFSKPLTLTRLAHYLMDWHRENGKWTGLKARPLVLLAEKPRTKTFLVVGYEYPEAAGDLTKNRFGKHFELTAQSMTGTFRFDSFESNVVEVARADAQRFIEQLHYLIDSTRQE